MIRKSFSYSIFSKLCNKKPITKNTLIQTRLIKEFHCTTNFNAKIFIETENQYAYEILENNGYVSKLNIEENRNLWTNDEFKNFKEKNWSKESVQCLFKTFSVLGPYCSENNLTISDSQFDDYIDSLTDNIKFATDEELKSLFYSLSKFPKTESIKTRNFIEVWAALDDECFNRIIRWSFDEMLSFLSLFYMLNIIRASDFAYKCLLKLTNKANKLNKSQVVQTYFFIGTARKSPKDIHNLEIAVDKQFSQFTVDELAIIAMGLFKSKTPIRNLELITHIIETIKTNSKNIHEISLASLLKIVRYSLKIPEENKIYDLLETLQYEVSRLSIMCNVQLALVGTSTLELHENCLTKIAEKMLTTIKIARIKDIERIILTYGTFNFKPKTETSFFSHILEELRFPDREEEIRSHGRSFACCIAYLGLLGIYPEDLMNKALSKEFLEFTYGKYSYQFGREILTIHNTAKIFLKNEKMNLLNEKQVIMLSKKYTDYLPSESYQKQYNVSEKMFMDVKNVLEIIQGGKLFVTGHHIVTHHQRGDLIVCNDCNGKPLPVKETFSKIQFGHLCEAPDNNIWTVFVIAGRNTMTQNFSSATGQFTSKVRELQALGYKAVIVKWNVYNKLRSSDEKIKYLHSLTQN